MVSDRMNLADKLQCTVHCSLLQRKARRLGLATVEEAIALAVDRGCAHYRGTTGASAPKISHPQFSNTELVVLLLLNQQSYSPNAIRCAAQLARSPDVTSGGLALAARKERIERQLSHIATAGLHHDPCGADFWQEVLDRLGVAPREREEHLPHWSRFVSSPGLQRGTMIEPSWLIPLAS